MSTLCKGHDSEPRSRPPTSFSSFGHYQGYLSGYSIIVDRMLHALIGIPSPHMQVIYQILGEHGFIATLILPALQEVEVYWAGADYSRSPP